MVKKPKYKFQKSIKWKIVIASVVACTALYLAWQTAKIAFYEILNTVENISEPTERLRLVNDLSLKVVRLEQLQKSVSLKNTSDYKQLQKESKELVSIIDSLQYKYRNDSLQLARIASMKQLLKERDKLFSNYLTDRRGFLDNKSIEKQLRSLNDLVEENARKTDSAILESEKRTLTTTIYELEEKRVAEESKGFLNRIFGRKKETPKNPAYNIVNEELNVKLDTVALNRQDSILRNLGESMRFIEETQRQKSKTFLNTEAMFIYANDLLFSRLLTTLRQVESEAVYQIQKRNEQAKSVVNSGIKHITIIILVFFLVTLIMLYLILRDLSKGNAYRKQLEQAKEEAEYHSMAKQRFLANMSHEIRTPLQTIIGFSELIKKEKDIKEKHIDAIYYSSEHLMHIVNEILDYNRIVSGKISISPIVFKLENVLQEILTVLKYHAEKKGIKLYADFDFEDVDYVRGDAFRLKQILYNILGNAIKYTEKGHVALNVSCKKNKSDLHFMFVVEDTGIGMSYEDTQHIFNEFERVDKIAATKEGTGLGLSITKLLVEQQGGRISVRSKQDEGSTFTVYLKYEEVETLEAEKAIKNITPKIAVGGKVWLVDDDPFILDLCSTILANYKIAHVCFSNPKDLLNAQWDDAVKFVLTDIRMPEISGIELCQKLRTYVPSAVKIYALTAQVLPEEKALLLDSGFDGILHKPFKEEDLIELLGVQRTEGAQDFLDFSNIEKMTFGDKDQLDKLLQRFLEDTKKDQQLLQKAIEMRDEKEIALIAHRLAGRIAQFGGKELGESLRKIELEINGGKMINESFYNSLEILQDKISRMLIFIENKK